MSNILNLTATVTRGKIALTWQHGAPILDNGGNRVKVNGIEQFTPIAPAPPGYRVKRTTSADEQENAEVFSSISPTTAYNDTTVDPGVTYYYFIDAANQDGTFPGDYSQAVVVESEDIERVTVAPTAIGWVYGGSSVKLHIFSNHNFKAADGTNYRKGGKTDNWFKEIVCPIADGFVAVPEMILPPTTDSSNRNATLSGFFTKNGIFAGYFFERWKIPHTLGDSIDWGNIRTANEGASDCGEAAPAYAPTIEVVQGIVSDIINAVKMPFARFGKRGLVELDAPPSNPLKPVAVGINSPRLLPPVPLATKAIAGKFRLSKDGEDTSVLATNEKLYSERVVFFEDYIDASKSEAAPDGDVRAAFQALLADHPKIIPGLASQTRRKQITNVMVSRETTIDFDLDTHYNLEFAFTGEGMFRVKNKREPDENGNEDENGEVIETYVVKIGRMALTGARQIFDVEEGSSLFLGNKAVSNSTLHLEWWTGAADEDDYVTGLGPDRDNTAVNATLGLRCARQSIINNHGGTIKIGTGNFITYEQFFPSIGMILEMSGANSYGKKNPNNAGVSGAIGGGTNLIYKGDEDEFIVIGDADGGANNTRTIQIKNGNIDTRGTNAGCISVQGSGQNIYGFRGEELVLLNSSKYAFDINVQNAAQVEEILLDHCELISSVGAEGCFRVNTNNGTNLFTQCYFATPPNKDCLFINKCGTTNLLNCHLVGANTVGNGPVLEGRAGVHFGFINGGQGAQNGEQGVDITNFSMIGCQDEALNYSIISEAFQVPHPSTLIGCLFQGNMLVRGRHVFIEQGCTLWGRAWRDTPHDITDPLDARYARHPYVPDGAGGLAFANSRIYSTGSHYGGNRVAGDGLQPRELVIDPVTRRSTYVKLDDWGQTDKFDLTYSFSEVMCFDDPVNDIKMERGYFRHFINRLSKWVQFETFDQNTPMRIYGTNQPFRAVLGIATTIIDPIKRVEKVAGSPGNYGIWKMWRDNKTGDFHLESGQKYPNNNFYVRGGVLGGKMMQPIQGAYTLNPVVVEPSDGSRYRQDDNGRLFTCVGATTVMIPKPVLTPAEIAAISYPDKPPLEIELGTAWSFIRHAAGAVILQLSQAAIDDGYSILKNGAFSSSVSISAQYKRLSVEYYYPKVFRVIED